MPKPPTRTAPTARLSDARLSPLDNSVCIWPGMEGDVSGVRINARITPPLSPGHADAEPALFVHGLGGSAHNWTDFAGLLRGHLAIESIDLPGHGRSGPADPHGYTPDRFADIVIAYLEQSGRAPVHLAGNSMGGAVSILVTARRPDLVRTLTLISPAVPDNRFRVYPLRNDPRVALLALPVLGEWALRRMSARVAPEVRAKGTIALCFADASRYPSVRLAEAIDEMRWRETMPWAGPAFLRSMRGLVTSQFRHGRAFWTALRSITAPTLVVWGDTDRLVAPDLAPYVAAAIPDSRLLMLDDIGHTAMMEDPRTTARAMLALLEDARAQT